MQRPPRRANGEAIAAIRQALGIRQDALAARVGVTKAQMNKVEHDVNGASPQVIAKIAAELGVSYNAITQFVPDPAPIPDVTE